MIRVKCAGIIERGMSDYRRLMWFLVRDFQLEESNAKRFCLKHRDIFYKVNVANVKDSSDVLKQNNISNEQILSKPSCLLLDKSLLKNRFQILDECEFKKNLFTVQNYQNLMKQSISYLRLFEYINKDANTIAHDFCQQLDVEIPTPKTSDKVSLRNLRAVVISAYIGAKMQLSSEDMDKISMPPFKLQSLKSLSEIIPLLQDKVGMTKADITSNIKVLLAAPNNVERILQEIPEHEGIPIQHFIMKAPRILLTDCETIRSNLKFFKGFGITNAQIENCPEALTKDPEKTYNWLIQMKQSKDLDIMLSHENVLRLLIARHNPFKRFEQIKSSTDAPVNLSLLSLSEGAFAKEEVHVFAGRDAAFYISKCFKMTATEAMTVLEKHPHWLTIPPLAVKSTIEYLRSKKFSNEEIAKNLLLLLYPVQRIKPQMNIVLSKNTKVEDVPLNDASNTERLNICLYLIEKEFNFSGDGVWEHKARVAN